MAGHLLSPLFRVGVRDTYIISTITGWTELARIYLRFFDFGPLVLISLKGMQLISINFKAQDAASLMLAAALTARRASVQQMTSQHHYHHRRHRLHHHQTIRQ